MSDKFFLRFIDCVGIMLIALEAGLLISSPGSIELIKVATPKEIATIIIGNVTFFSGGFIYLFSKKIFLREEKEK